jgi:hypothetical protein
MVTPPIAINRRNKMQTHKEYEIYKNHAIYITQDEDVPNPRHESDNIAKMICWHPFYQIGDHHNWDNHKDFKAHLAQNKNIYSQPLYLYNHTNLVLSTTPFNCQWDSGQTGWIIIEDADLIQDTGKCKAICEAEIKEYNQFINGEVYCYEIIELYDYQTIDECGGFYSKLYCLDAAKEMIDHRIRNSMLLPDN